VQISRSLNWDLSMAGTHSLQRSCSSVLTLAQPPMIDLQELKGPQ
jgi:hypothetical protein